MLPDQIAFNSLGTTNGGLEELLHWDQEEGLDAEYEPFRDQLRLAGSARRNCGKWTRMTGWLPWSGQTLTPTMFRHRHNRKWFAIIMDIPREKLGLPGDGIISVVNVKCDPRLIGSFREEPGIFPAYHMNKAHWLTVALDGSAEEEKLRFLLDMSYELTK